MRGIDRNVEPAKSGGGGGGYPPHAMIKGGGGVGCRVGGGIAWGCPMP